MPEYLAPGVYIEEVPSLPPPVEGVATSMGAFIGFFPDGPFNEPVRVTGLPDFENTFGVLAKQAAAGYGVSQFFQNGGRDAWVVRVTESPGGDRGAALLGNRREGTGLYALEGVDLFNLLAIPDGAWLPFGVSRLRPGPVRYEQLMGGAQAFCEERRAFLLMDFPGVLKTPADVSGWLTKNESLRHPNAAVFYPWLSVPNAIRRGGPLLLPPSGTMAGVIARIDEARGVWKAPAGIEATLRNVKGLDHILGVPEQDQVNTLGINALREIASGRFVLWGARTLMGADRLGSEWKYIPVRRTALFLEESIYRGTHWTVFEPNNETLWARIRQTVGAFLNDLFLKGAFQGATPREAYFVRCDRETTTQQDVDAGALNILVGFALIKPAEFVVLKITQNMK